MNQHTCEDGTAAGHTACTNPELIPFGTDSLSGDTKMKGFGLWLLGVPVFVIVLLYLFGIM